MADHEVAIGGAGGCRTSQGEIRRIEGRSLKRAAAAASHAPARTAAANIGGPHLPESCGPPSISWLVESGREEHTTPEVIQRAQLVDLQASLRGCDMTTEDPGIRFPPPLIFLGLGLLGWAMERFSGVGSLALPTWMAWSGAAVFGVPLSSSPSWPGQCWCGCSAFPWIRSDRASRTWRAACPCRHCRPSRSPRWRSSRPPPSPSPSSPGSSRCSRLWWPTG